MEEQQQYQTMLTLCALLASMEHVLLIQAVYATKDGRELPVMVFLINFMHYLYPILNFL